MQHRFTATEARAAQSAVRDRLRHCRECAAPFHPTTGRALFCSPTCRRKRARRNRQQARAGVTA